MSSDPDIGYGDADEIDGVAGPVVVLHSTVSVTSPFRLRSFENGEMEVFRPRVGDAIPVPLVQEGDMPPAYAGHLRGQ